MGFDFIGQRDCVLKGCWLGGPYMVFRGREVCYVVVLVMGRWVVGFGVG